METWERFKREFSTSIEAGYATALKALGMLGKAPESYRGLVTEYLRVLSETKSNLDIAYAMLPNQPTPFAVPASAPAVERAFAKRWAEQRDLYGALVLGVGQNSATVLPTTVPTKPETGFFPAIPTSVVIVIGTLGLTAAGIAWCVASYEDAVTLRDHTALLKQELAARTEAMRTGKTLQPATVEPAAKPDKGNTWLLALAGIGAAAAAAVFITPKLGKG